jgi:hypothetical protein
MGVGREVNITPQQEETMQLQLGFGLTAEMKLRDKYQEFMDYWGAASKQIMPVDFLGFHFDVEWAYAPRAFLQHVGPDDYGVSYRLGSYRMGEPTMGMDLWSHFPKGILVASELSEEHEHWVPFVVIKLFFEWFVDPGRDTTGVAKHLAAAVETVRLASHLLPKEEWEKFIQVIGREIPQHQSMLMIEMERGPNRSNKSDYLKRHHGNRWVRAGRKEEALYLVVPDLAWNRNRAEIVWETIMEYPKLSYLVQHVVKTLDANQEGSMIEFPMEVLHAVQCLTREFNRVVDLCEIQGVQDGKLLVLNRGDRFRQPTLDALKKRIGYGLWCMAERAKRLASSYQPPGELELDETSDIKARYEELAKVLEEVI